MTVAGVTDPAESGRASRLRRGARGPRPRNPRVPVTLRKRGSSRRAQAAFAQARSFQPVRKIHHTAAMQASRKPTIAARLMPTFTSEVP